MPTATHRFDAPTVTGPSQIVTRVHVRIVRVALSWVIVVCLFFLSAFPVLIHLAPGHFRWTNFAVTVGYVIAAVFGIVMIPRQPRDVVGVLSAAFTTNALSALNILKWLSPRRTWPGPAATVGTSIALSLLLVFAVALVTAWRAHLGVRDHAI